MWILRDLVGEDLRVLPPGEHTASPLHSYNFYIGS